MSINRPIWEWYNKNDHAIQAILEIACELIPGARIIQNSLKAVYALYKDHVENKNQSQIEEIQDFLVEIQPSIKDLVSKISQSFEFQAAKNIQEECVSVRKIFAAQLPPMLSSITPSINKSIRSLSQKKAMPIINQRYEIVELLGAGGQGEVYKARDITANRWVAIKLLPSILSQDSTFISALRQEYNRVIDLLVHPNIVQYRSLEENKENQQLFIVMDYVEGINLRQWLIQQNNQPISFAKAIDLLKPIAEALDFAHHRKVCHCDLKPENILIRQSDQQVFLTDFGLAKEIRSTLSRKSTLPNISGTLPYMAPEQYLGRRPDGSTDIWALGVMLYELVSGSHPFQGTSFEHYMKLICDIEPELIPELSQSQFQIILQMLRKDRTQRPTSAKQALANVKVDKEEKKANTLQNAIEQAREKNEMPKQVEMNETVNKNEIATDGSQGKKKSIWAKRLTVLFIFVWIYFWILGFLVCWGHFLNLPDFLRPIFGVIFGVVLSIGYIPPILWFFIPFFLLIVINIIVKTIRGVCKFFERLIG